MRDFNSLSHASLSPSGNHNAFIHCMIPSDVPLPSSIFLLPVCLLLLRGVSPANLACLTPSGPEHFNPLPRVQAVMCWALVCRASPSLTLGLPHQTETPQGWNLPVSPSTPSRPSTCLAQGRTREGAWRQHALQSPHPAPPALHPSMFPA